MNCAFLGRSLGAHAKVACVAIEGRDAYKPLFACDSPDVRQHTCIPDWPGPWKLPERADDAVAIALCHGCPQRR